MGSSKKVLYAEDEAQLSAAVVEILQMEGFDVTAVPDGISALEELKSGYFDVVVLDIMMPGTDGLTVCKQLRAISDVPIAMTVPPVMLATQPLPSPLSRAPLPEEEGPSTMTVPPVT